MRGNIISYFDMCQMEGTSLQRGMNFRLRGRHSKDGFCTRARCLSLNVIKKADKITKGLN